MTAASKPESDLIVTRNGVPFEDQAEGLAPRMEAEQYFPGTGRMFAHARRLAVTKEWLAGWDACLAELDKRGCFTRDAFSESQK